MPTMKRIAPGRYNGIDPATNEWVGVDEGQHVEVSDEKAAQLKCDFPGDWEVVGGAPRAGVTDEEKRAIAARLDAGEDDAAIAAEFGVDENTIYRWAQPYRAASATKAAPRNKVRTRAPKAKE